MTNNIKAAESIMGQKMKNPLGSCFDSAAYIFVEINVTEQGKRFKNSRIYHGIGIANMPGQEGNVMAHAWIEAYSKEDKMRLAIDPIWVKGAPVAHYRQGMKISYSVSYGYKYFLKRMKVEDYPGPWDKKIKAVIDSHPKM